MIRTLATPYCMLLGPPSLYSTAVCKETSKDDPCVRLDSKLCTLGEKHWAPLHNGRTPTMCEGGGERGVVGV